MALLVHVYTEPSWAQISPVQAGWQGEPRTAELVQAAAYINGANKDQILH